jgi:hypothetical protein
MKSMVQPDKRLAEAVAVLVEAIHHDFPMASTRPLAPYADEVFTLEVRIPAGMDRDTVRDACLRHALTIEDQFGFFILTRVKVAETAEASAGAPLP